MRPTHIIIHHSASAMGDAAMIDEWHRARGWQGIGYHYVVGNGRGMEAGEVQAGRPEAEMGAHCKGRNRDSIGVCLIGPAFDYRQILAAVSLCLQIMGRHGIPPDRVLGHREAGDSVECPGIDMDLFRAALGAPVWGTA